MSRQTSQPILCMNDKFGQQFKQQLALTNGQRFKHTLFLLFESRLGLVDDLPSRLRQIQRLLSSGARHLFTLRYKIRGLKCVLLVALQRFLNWRQGQIKSADRGTGARQTPRQSDSLRASKARQMCQAPKQCEEEPNPACL